MRRRALALLILPLWLVLAAACEREGQQAAATATPPPAIATPSAAATAAQTPAATATATVTPTPTPTANAGNGALPRFEPASCPFALASGQEEGRTVFCGYVVTPEDYARPDGAVIRLAVARFRPARHDEDPTPVFWLDGGPGGESLHGLGEILSPFMVTALAGPRELVVFDQRGVGLSRPSLACAELVELKYASAPKRLTRQEDAANMLRAALACRDRLRAAGVDLAAYTSASNAADVNAIRAALGYQRVNLFGVSYGTRLALTVMRDFPAILRAVVLDSPVPVQASLYTEVYASADRAFTLLFQGCDAAQACDRAYPDLEQRFTALVGRLNREPVTVAFSDTGSGRKVDYVLTGDRLVSAFFQMLYQSTLIGRLPGIIVALENGNTGPFRRAYGDLLFFDGISHGMHYSVQCAEEARFTTDAQVRAAARAVRPELGLGEGDGFNEDWFFPLCAAWGAKVVAPVENEPVRSDVPVLVLSGQYDPITPPSYGVRVAETLPNATVLEFPGLGHGPGLSDICPLQIVLAFLGDPARRPDGACAGRLSGPRWDVP